MKRKNVLRGVAAGLFLTLLMAGIVYAAVVDVDLFNNGTEYMAVNDSSPSASALYDGGADILGGERDSEVGWVSGTTGWINLRIDYSNSNVFDYSSDPNMAGTARVTWDGNDNNASVLDPTGLGGVNLSDSGANEGLRVAVVFDDLPASLTFKVYTNASNWSYFTVLLPGALDGVPSRMDLVLPFSTFTVGGGSGADFTSVGAVVMDLDGTITAGSDVQIDLLEATTAREYGDLPNTYSVISAYHVPQGVRLGTNVDAEGIAAASTGSDGDDSTDFDDEDGVLREALPWCAGIACGQVRVVVRGCPDDNCYVNGWIDWNRDGDFNDTDVNGATERIFLRQRVAGGIYFYTFDTPDPFEHNYYYARFRVCRSSTACDDPGESPVINGEVEDYRWPLGPTAITLSSITARSAPLAIGVGTAALLGLLALGALFVARRRKA